jgi:hypothetical protein
MAGTRLAAAADVAVGDVAAAVTAVVAATIGTTAAAVTTAADAAYASALQHVYNHDDITKHALSSSSWLCSRL